MMMAGDYHSVAQAAFPQRSLEIRHALVAGLGIIFIGAHNRCRFASSRLILADPEERNLWLVVHHGRDTPSRGVVRQLNSLAHLFLFLEILTASARRRKSRYCETPIG